MTAMTLLADVATALGDPEWARGLYDLLLPHRNTTVVIGIAAVCLGSTARYLGRLATTMGQPAVAREHLEHALRVNEALQARPQLAHAQLDYAQALGRGARSKGLIAAAGETADELGLPAVKRRLG
jgi:hypothetical protein